MKSFRKFLEPEEDPIVIFTDKSLEYVKDCEDVFWIHCASTPHRSETNGIAERAVRQIEASTLLFSYSSDWMNNGGPLQMNVNVICAIFMIFRLMDKLLKSADSVSISLDFFYDLGQQLSINP